jgi:hypothetical protein
VYSILKLNQAVANSVTASVYQQPVTNASYSQYFISRSFLFNAGPNNNDSILAQLYVRDSDFLAVLNDTSGQLPCKPKSIYTMGVTTYDTPNFSATENASLNDNVASGFTFKPYSQLSWVPYDSGYYVQVPMQHYGEVWIHDGGCSNQLGLADSASFTCNAILSSLTKASVQWDCSAKDAVKNFIVQRSTDMGKNYETIQDAIANTKNTYIDSCDFVYYQKVFYRVIAAYENGNTDTSSVDSVSIESISQHASALLFPNPTTSIKGLQIRFISLKDDCSIIVLNAMGQIVYQDFIDKNNLTSLYAIDLKSFSPGLYFVQLKARDFEQRTKVLVH